MQMKKMFSLTADLTKEALVGRKIYKLSCCEKPMRQVDLKTHLPKESRPFGVSAMTLKCVVCHRHVSLDTFNGVMREYDVLGYMKGDR